MNLLPIMKKSLQLSIGFSTCLSAFLPFCLSALLPFCLSAQNMTVSKNANGDHILQPLNTSQSVYFGQGSGSVATGIYNTGIGAYALNLNNSGLSNTAVGNSAMALNTSGGLNTAMGTSALYGNLTGAENTAIGTFALYDNKGRSRSTAIGFKSMYYANSAAGAGTTFNTAVGYEALRGSLNSVNNTGINNTAVGDQAMNSNTSGSSNTALGLKASFSNTTGYSNVAIGVKALHNNLVQYNTVAIGDSALYSNTNGIRNSAVGSKALYANTSGHFNTAMGYRALHLNQNGTDNTAVGHHASAGNVSGSKNVSVGSSALFNCQNGSNNVVIGQEAFVNNSSGSNNTIVGFNSGFDNFTGSGNVFLGHQAGRTETGSNKLYIQNSNADSTNALIFGNFSTKRLRFNARSEIYTTNQTFGLQVEAPIITNEFNPFQASIVGYATAPNNGVGVIGYGGQNGVSGFASNTSTGAAGVRGVSAGANEATNTGVTGSAQSANFNVGVYGEAKESVGTPDFNFGVSGTAYNASIRNVGVQGIALGDLGEKRAGEFTAEGNGFNYGIYAAASGGTYNYAGYFDDGDVLVNNSLGVGKDPGVFGFALRHSNYGLQIQNAVSESGYWELYQGGSATGSLLFYTESGGSVANINYTSGAYSATSDRRLKENIQPMDSVLKDVMKLQASQYSYKTDTDHKPCIGFIAQDVEPLFPQIVTPPIVDGERETNYTMDYSGFGVLAIKAIQEQQVIIDSQEARIAKLEALVAELAAKAQ